MATEVRGWIEWSTVDLDSIPLCTVKRCSLCCGLVLPIQEELDGHEMFHERIAAIALKAGLADLEAIGARRNARDRSLRSPVV